MLLALYLPDEIPFAFVKYQAVPRVGEDVVLPDLGIYRVKQVTYVFPFYISARDWADRVKIPEDLGDGYSPTASLCVEWLRDFADPALNLNDLKR